LNPETDDLSSNQPSGFPARARRERLFFALWPDPATRAALARLLRLDSIDLGRPVTVANLHLTLAFLGACDRAQRDGVESLAARLTGSPFILTLNRLGCWSRSRIVWSAPETTPAALAGLVGGLHEALAARGLVAERRPFHAHVTLARRVSGARPDQPHPPIRWPVDAFCLVASETRSEGARYRVLRRWPLLGGPGCGGRKRRLPLTRNHNTA